MQFQNLVVILAVTGIGFQAGAQGGTLRRGYQVAQNDSTSYSEAQPTQGVVIMNTNTNTNSSTGSAAASARQGQVATQQPITIVEANPVSDSRAEQMRRARQNAEVQTEQKIVEKLEESRLREEAERAERLFGNKFETPATTGGAAAAASATAVATPNGAAASATATAVTTTAEPAKEERATNVTIEKVEIHTPAPAPLPAPEVDEEPVTESKIILKEAKEELKQKYYISPILGVTSYNASNVKSNHALGVGLGTILDNKIGLEGSFIYSNHNVDTYWDPKLYNDLEQYDFSASAKWYVFPGKVKPYVGGSMTYIYRLYQDRYMGGTSWSTNPYSTSEESHALNLGLLGGLDFMINDNFMIGAGMDWNFNIMTKSDFNYSAYNLPANTKPLEEIDYYTLKLNAKFSF